MNFSVTSSGEITSGRTLSKAGDYVDLLVDMDLLVAISNCPQELNEANGFNPTALRVAVFDGPAYRASGGETES
jgi:uncharacterized protein YcgI (DUF1989 family)